MSTPPAPRARWPRPADTPREKWIGRYALPIAGTVTTVPTVVADGGLQVRLETWEYGDVAEILHVGRYSDEEADIGRLHSFIASSGYSMIGDHEEEYVRGPGVFFRGDPRKYLTIIRLRIAPAAGRSCSDSESQEGC